MVNRRLRTSQKIPTAGLGLQSLGVSAQDLRCIFRWIDTERNKMHVRFLERPLQFAHSAADHRTRAGAGRVNEIGDPNLSTQLGGAEILPVLIYQDKLGNTSVRRNRALSKRIYLELS